MPWRRGGNNEGEAAGSSPEIVTALRTLLKVTAARDGEPVSLEIL